MEKKDGFSKILAIAGAALAWIPILAPLLFSVVSLISLRVLRFDYLMPAELFPVALMGGGLLLWAGLRLRSRQKIIGWGLVCAIGLLGASQGLVVVTRLASGETAPTGLWWVLALTTIIGYTLALIVTGIGGVLLLRDLFKNSRYS